MCGYDDKFWTELVINTDIISVHTYDNIEISIKTTLN